MKILKFAVISFFSMCLLACGNKEAKEVSDEAIEPAAVSVSGQDDESLPVEEISLSFTRVEDPCFGNDPDYLHIKGGKPFDDEANPYKVEAKNTNKGSITLGKFTQEDGTFTIEIPGSSSSVEDEVRIEIVVTDANGTEKTIDYIIPFCI